MKTSFNDIRNPNCEQRNYTVTGEGLEAPSSRIQWIRCPFCTHEVKAYVWSLSGGGKRCDCGALFNARGIAYKMPDIDRTKEVEPL